MLDLKLPENYNTKFEKARLIGSRALQISMGAPFLVEISKAKLAELKFNPVEIAKLEYNEGAIPMEVKRMQPHEK